MSTVIGELTRVRGGHGACAVYHPCQAETGACLSYGRSQHVIVRGLAYWLLFVFIAKAREFGANLDLVLHRT